MSAFSPPQSGDAALEADTQPYSQWVYDQYRTKAVGSSQPANERDRNPTDETSAQLDQMANQNENDVEIDLVTGFQQSQTRSDSNESDCSDSSVKPNDNAFSSSPGMVDILSGDGSSQQAKTPVSHWGKQIGYGRPRSEATTPALPVNPFAQDGTTTGTVMGLSQVFRATQATTPLRHKLVSDPLTERPSPDIYNHQRRPAPAFISSPLQNLRTSSDRPIAKSSQNHQWEGESTSRKGRSSSINPSDSDESSDIDLGPSLSQQVRERIRRRKRDEEIKKSLEEFKVVLPEKEPGAKTRKSRGKDGKLQRAEQDQLSRKPQQEPIQSRKRAARPEEAESSSIEDDIVERVRPARNVSTVVSKGHGKERLGVIESAGVQAPMTMRQTRKSVIRPLLQDSPLSLIQQDPQNHRDSSSPISQSNLPTTTSSTSRDSVIVRRTPVDNITRPQQLPLQENPIGSKNSLGPHSSIIRSSAELASTNSETQSTIVQAEPNGRPNMNFTFKAVENSSASQPVASSGEVVRTSLGGTQEPNPQAEDVEIMAGRGDKAALEVRTPLHRERNATSSQLHIQLRPDSSSQSTREGSIPRGDSAIPASSEYSHARPQSGSRGRLGEGDATSLPNQSSVNANIVIPETSPAGGSWPLSPVIESTADSIHSFPASSRPRVNPLGNMANTAGRDEHIQDIRNASEIAIAPTATAVPERRSESNLLEQQVTSVRGQGSANEDQAFSTRSHESSEAQRHSETASTSDALEDHNVNSSPLSHAKKRCKGNNGNPVPSGHRQPAQLTISDTARAIDRTTTSSESGQIPAEPRKTNAKRRGRISEPLERLRQKSVVPRSTSGSKVTHRSPGHRTGRYRSSNDERSPVINRGDSPTSCRQLRYTRPELDSNHAPSGRGREERGPVIQEAGESSHEPSSTSMTNPDRVFALFKGVKMAFYPATCLSSVGSNECRIRFDDGNISVLDSSHVCSLNLQEGDVVKVDLPNMRQKNYVVIDIRSDEDHTVDTESQISGQYPKTDIYGHNIAVLRVKSGSRMSSAGATSNDDTVKVPLSKLYIVLSNWLKFKDRIHTHQSVQGETEMRPHTPTRAISAPLTPSSRSRRVKSATPRHGVPTSDRGISELFRNMAFAVSYGDKEVDRKLVIKHIEMNGGTVLEDGPSELFDLNSATAARGQSYIHSSEGQNHGVKLKSQWERTGFVCVLADQHSRRVKYMQALALGLPCLAGRWIEDCVRQNSIISWEPYILPSGESSYLGNAVRNRTLQYHPAETARLSSTIQTRPKLLEGKSVLIIRSGETAESRETFFFLIYALGASRIDRVANIEAANTTLTESRSNGHTWDFLYTGAQKVNSNDLRVSTVSAGMKRKRGFNARLRSVEDGLSDEPTKIIDNEYLVQSLILGRLLDE